MTQALIIRLSFFQISRTEIETQSEALVLMYRCFLKRQKLELLMSLQCLNMVNCVVNE